MKLQHSLTTSNTTQPQIDPLYTIFEQHLYNFQDSDSDRKTFIYHVVAEYLSFLRRKKIAVPEILVQSITEELARQVNTMLVKKIYGCLSIADFQKQISLSAKRRTKKRYSKMK